MPLGCVCNSSKKLFHMWQNSTTKWPHLLIQKVVQVPPPFKAMHCGPQQQPSVYMYKSHCTKYLQVNSELVY